MKRARLIVTFVLGISCALAIVALPAGAATQRANEPAVPESVSLPLVHYRAGWFSRTNSTGGVYYDICLEGDGDIIGNLITQIAVYAANGCNVRVWMYQTNHRTGYRLCISPRTQTGAIHRIYHSWWMSHNGNRC